MRAPREEDVPGSVDLVVLGSGVGGLTAALTAALEGLSVLILESTDLVGGTSARSSGTVWVPGNRAMEAAVGRDRTAAERYLEALVGDRGPGQLWRAFLDAAPQMQADLEDRAGVTLTPFRSAPDYRQDLPGAAPGWRAMEPAVFDGRELGPDFKHLRWPLPELMLLGSMMVTRAEGAALLRPDLRLGTALLERYAADRLCWPRGTRLVMGNALVAKLWFEARARGVLVRRNTSVSRLVVDGARISGVALEDGRTIETAKGVVLAGGGFPASAEWRERELPKPVAEHTPAAPGAVGRTLELGLEAGATLGPSGQDNALWFPSSLMTRADGSTAVWPHIVLDRAKPGSLVVDGTGRRFVNEAVSYHEFVRAMYRANDNGQAIPCWMICDRDFIRRYGLGLIRPRMPTLRRYIRNGYLTEAPDIAALAQAIGVSEVSLEGTVARFNAFAGTGSDADFGRGESIYDQAGGDPEHGPNPCLGPVARGPFYAVRLVPTPLGTSRGLSADTHGRALDAGGQAIEGLYVCGNDMHSAFGGEYPGAGAQLGQAMTFGWLAARHAAGLAAYTTREATWA